MLLVPTVFIKNAYAMYRFMETMSFHLLAMNETDENACQGHVFTDYTSHDTLYVSCRTVLIRSRTVIMLRLSG